MVISTYNGENYIESQMESIRNQTIEVDEVIIYDDNSTDKTVSIVKKFIKKNNLNNWNIVKNSINKGWRINFFEAIDNTDAEIIFLCDQDDIWIDNKVEVMLRYIEKNEEIEVLSSKFIRWDGLNKVQNDFKYKENKVERLLIENSIKNVSNPGCTYCFRKDFFNEIKPYWKKSFPHDAFLWRFAAINNALFEIDEPLILWRKHSKSTFFIEQQKNRSSREERIKEIRYTKEMYESLLRYAESKKLGRDEYNFIKKQYSLQKLREHVFTNSNLNIFRLLLQIKNYQNCKQLVRDCIILLLKK